MDRRLPLGRSSGPPSCVYNRDVNGIYYINANLPAPERQTSWVPTTARVGPRRNKLNSNVANAIVLKNQDVGRSWNLAFSLAEAFREGFLKAAYSYGEAKNTVDPGSIASGSWNGNQHSGDPNNPGLGLQQQLARATGSSSRVRTARSTATSAPPPSPSSGRGLPGGQLQSYTYSGDLNGDGGTANDLIYIPTEHVGDELPDLHLGRQDLHGG